VDQDLLFGQVVLAVQAVQAVQDQAVEQEEAPILMELN
jgi:hypothetical protein